jgi:hypothetical protein
MGYACPVCDDPQSDARHLANHLAFTAILGDEAHEAWLDEHAQGWADDGERELAERVTDHAEQREYPQLFEDTTGREDSPERDGDRSGELFEEEGHTGHDHLGRGHEHETHDHGHGTHDTDIPHEQADVPRDPETEAVLEEARELTREMLAAEDADADRDDEPGDDADE